MTPDERKRKLSAVTRFDNAAQNYAFQGAAHPDARDAIERKYLMAKANLLRELGIAAHVENRERAG